MWLSSKLLFLCLSVAAASVVVDRYGTGCMYIHAASRVLHPLRPQPLTFLMLTPADYRFPVALRPRTHEPCMTNAALMLLIY